MANEVIETRSGKFWLGEDGIVRIVIVPTPERSQADAEESIAAFVKLCRGQMRPALADIRNTKTTNREERLAYTKAEEAKLVLALGLLVESPLSRIIASFFLGISKLPFPTKVFTSEEAALLWLRGFVELKNG